MTFLLRFLLVMLPVLIATPAVSGVARFTDHKGTIHITNKAGKPQNQEQQENAAAPPASFQPASQSQDSLDRPIRLFNAEGTIHLTNAPAQEPEITQAAGRGPEGFPANSFAGSPVQPVRFSETNIAGRRDGAEAAPEAATFFQYASNKPDRVRKFTDRSGTIYITNRKAESGQFMLARDRSPEALPEGAERVRRPPAEPENLIKDMIKPASLALPPLPAPAAVAPALPSPSPGAGSHRVAGVRRYRDSQGVIHLVSTPRPAREDRGPPGWGPLPPNAALAELCQLPGPPEIAPLSLSKDSQGTLRLTNDRAAADWRQNRAQNLKAILAEASFWYGLPVPLIEALIKVESNFAASAVSPKGAMGLMQLMPGTAKDMGVTNPFCPRQNVLGGCRYLRMLLDACQRSLPLALAAYNAGYRRVADSGFKVPNIEETQAFVTQVLGHYYLAQKQKTRASAQLRL